MDEWAVDFASIIAGESKKAVPKNEPFIIGIVEVETPNLKISDGPEIVIYQEDLYVLENVLSNYERDVEYEQTHGTSSGKLRFTDTLKKGDYVALIPSGGEKYVLLGKVVQL